MPTPTPVILVTGFLGAGKTTLLCHLLKTTPQRVAVLMNEFGKLGIDTATIKREQIHVKELTGGCVCCSLQGELTAALKDLQHSYHPDIILIETTGLAEPDALILTLEKSLKGFILETVVTVADADGLLRFSTINATERSQLAAADIIILNKIDLVTPKDQQQLILQLQTINCRAKILPTTQGIVPWDELIVPHVQHKTAHQKQHTLLFRSCILHVPSTTKSLFRKWVQQMPPSIVRMKGHVQLGTTTYLFNFVRGRREFHRIPKGSEPTATNIVIIGPAAEPFETAIPSTNLLKPRNSR